MTCALIELLLSVTAPAIGDMRSSVAAMSAVDAARSAATSWMDVVAQALRLAYLDGLADRDLEDEELLVDGRDRAARASSCAASADACVSQLIVELDAVRAGHAQAATLQWDVVKALAEIAGVDAALLLKAAAAPDLVAAIPELEAIDPGESAIAIASFACEVWRTAVDRATEEVQTDA